MMDDINIDVKKEPSDGAKRSIPPRYAERVRDELHADLVALYVIRNGDVSVSVVGEDRSGDCSDGVSLFRALRGSAADMEKIVREGILKQGGRLRDYGLE